MAARTLAFTLGALFTHQLAELPDVLYLGLAPILLLVVLLRAPCALGAAFLLGIAWTAVYAQVALDRRLPSSAQRADAVIDGRIVETFAARARRLRFTVQVEQLSVPPATGERLAGWRWQGCRISVTWYRADEWTRPRAGERWRLMLRLRQPRGLRNPQGFDTEHRALRERRCATAYVRADSVPMRLPGSSHSLHRLRADIAARIDAHLADSEFAGVVVALAVGIRDRLPGSQRDLLQRTGTAHLMAISGLHIGLVAALGMLLGRLCARAIPRAMLLFPASHWGAASAFALALVYAALAGFSVSTQRALLMLSTFLLAAMLGRRIARQHGLALALLVILIVDPLAVHEVGTWLSFLAVAGLLWALGSIRSSTDVTQDASTARIWLARGWQRMCTAARVQLAATVVVLPLAMSCFAFQSLLSPLANLVAIPITGMLVVPITLVAVAIDPLASSLAGVLFAASAQLLALVFAVLEGISAMDLLFTPARSPTWLALLAALVGVALLLAPLRARLRLVGMFWLAPLLAPPAAAPPAGGLNLHVLDVGQGLAVVLRTHSHTLLFDAGPAWSSGNDAGAHIVVPMLRHQGISLLDRVLISHHHQDHAGGLNGVLRAMPDVEVIGDPGEWALSAGACRAGHAWRWDAYEFRILHPARSRGSNSPAGRRAGNDGSCVLHVAGPGGSVLLPADIEAAAEEAVLRFAADSLASDVLLVPHHGSRTSSTPAFLAAVRPGLAINSSGHRNRFRLPATDVVERYRARRIPLIDTACLGAVDVQLRAGQRPRVRHWSQGQLRFWHSRDRAQHCEHQGAAPSAWR